tara:strand:+ start:336 stop:611 length:276 start_codon:yes stop_codon:yes gene_type:complete
MSNAAENDSRPDATADTLIDSVFSGEVYPAYIARGCEYVIECYDDLSDGIAGVVVYCYSAKGVRRWDSCTSVHPGERVIDVVRSAKDALSG